MPLPAGWLNTDVGSTGLAGTSNESAGTYTIDGAGRDISGRSDAFQFAYQHAEYTTGDQEIVARVATQENTEAYCKAGVMVRQTLRNDSKFAAMVMTPSGAKFIYRQTRGSLGIIGGTVIVGGESLAVRAPYFVRILRNGQDFSGWIKLNIGDAWVQVGSTVRINFDFYNGESVCYVGLAVTSHDATQLSTATFDNVSETFGAADAWHYVSPTAAFGGGSGTWASPWHIKKVFTALDVTAIVDNAKVFLLEGTYRGRFHSRLTGSAGNPIVVRNYPDEKPVLDGIVTTIVAADFNNTTTGIVTFAEASIAASPSSGSTPDVMKIGSEQLKGFQISNTEVDLTSRGQNGTTAANHTIGQRVQFEGPILLVDGSHCDYVGFEVTCSSSESRYEDTNTYNGFNRPKSIDHLGTSNRFINLEINNGGTNFSDQSGGHSSTINGCILHSHGMAQIDGPAGHNLYIQVMTAETKTVRDNIVFGSFANNVNVSSSFGALNWIGNVLTGKLPGSGDSSLRNQGTFVVTHNMTWREGPQWGPDTGSSSVNNITFEDNYIQGMAAIQQYAGGTVLRNTIVPSVMNTGSTLKIRGTATTTYNVNDNRLYRGRTGLKTVFKFQDTDYAFSSASLAGQGAYWTGLTGSSVAFDANAVYSTQSSNQETAAAFFHENTSASTGAQRSINDHYLRIYTFNPNRAMLVIYNWENLSTMPVTVTGFLSSGDIFRVRFAGNLEADPVVAPTTYTSGQVSIPMAAIPMSRPNGYWQQVATTLPAFGVFLVERL